MNEIVERAAMFVIGASAGYAFALWVFSRRYVRALQDHIASINDHCRFVTWVSQHMIPRNLTTLQEKDEADWWKSGSEGEENSDPF